MEQDAESNTMETEASSHRNAENATDTLDDTVAEHSIIGKVKSRVSSIIPNSLSKWFSSPSTKSQHDSTNGNLSNSSIGHRRRRLELDDDDDDDDDDEYIDEEEDDDDDEEEEVDDQEGDEYEDQVFPNQQDNSDNDSSNSEATVSESDRNPTSPSIKNSSRDLLKSNVSDHRQPAKKRSRLDNSPSDNIRNIRLMARPPLVASTPGSSSGGSGGNMRYTPLPRRPANRYNNLKLYAGQVNKNPPYNFNLTSNMATMKPKPSSCYNDHDIVDLVSEHTTENLTQTGEFTHFGSRRTLNIPPTTTIAGTAASFRNCKRQLASDTPISQGNTSITLSHSMPKHTSATCFETDSNDVTADVTAITKQRRPGATMTAVQEEFVVNDDGDDDEGEYANAVNELQGTNVYNGIAKDVIRSKRQRLAINGSDDANIRDSISESNETATKPENTGMDRACSHRPQQKTSSGLFNMSTAVGRHVGNVGHGSRSSSFGSGLNFSTHLEGRKSLFADSDKRSEKNDQSLNNSTLSLTSLNRRQFNASIYGSTSALSDSRLLNTFSPFYKGRTIYGGAAAYKKYSNTGANSVRITPTLIRPTSSLSTLSSSNNSLNHVGTFVTENPSGISSTAKRILDLINDFSTPLSEAKKMASNLKVSHNQQQVQQHQQQQQQQSNQTITKLRRFNETDLNATRAMRLSQVRTPYARPSVILQPKNKLSNSLLPPVRELQVPSMSQLLQMKKLQNTTERSRLIVKENSNSKMGVPSLSADYTLPTNLEGTELDQRKQKQHTNKIRNKITSTRITGSSKDTKSETIGNDAPLNLPNIAFPLMESVPKFDIEVSAVKPDSKASCTKVSFTSLKPPESKKAEAEDNAPVTNVMPLEQKGPTTLTNTSLNFNKMTTANSFPGDEISFKFSLPLQLNGGVCATTVPITLSANQEFTFSTPIIVGEDVTITNTTSSLKPSPPSLKTGSVLDALKKPFSVSGEASMTMKGKNDTGFGQFKRSEGEWECSTCLVRNKKDATVCVACETKRKIVDGVASVASSISSSSSASTAAASLTSTALGFGNQFKQSSNEWECKVCMIRNKIDMSNCAACQTPRQTTNPAENKTISKVSGATVGNSFGESFKPKADTWECPTCLIFNKQTSNECVACGTKKLDKSLPSTKMNLVTSKSNAISSDFKQLAANQKMSKWECEACMTRNDEARIKCVCCEQAKPGVLVKQADVPKFAFGSTAASKFSFGFGNQNALKENEMRKVENSEKLVTVSPTKPTFSFGSTDATKKNKSGFSFGFKSTTDETDAKETTASKKGEGGTDATAPILSKQFKFGDPTASNTTTCSSAAAAVPSGLSSGTNVATTSAESTAQKENNSLFNSPKNKEIVTETSSIFGSNLLTPPVTTCKSMQQQSVASSSTTFTFSQAKPENITKLTESTGVSKSADSTTSTVTPIVTTSGGSSVSSNKTAFTFGTIPKTTESAPPDSETKTGENAKPLFTFGLSKPALSSSSASVVTTAVSPTTVAKTTTGGFSFGNIAPSSISSTSSSSLKTSFFGGSPATSTTTSAALSAATTTASPAMPAVSAPATTSIFPSQTTSAMSFTLPTSVANSNIFGSFSAAPKAFSNPLSNNQTACMSSAASTTNSFGTISSAAPSNIFGTFSSNNDGNANKSKAVASTSSLFGAPSGGPQTKGLFGFTAKAGVGPTTAITTNISVTTETSAASATSTTWPKNSFVFGSPSALSAASSTTATTSDSTKVQLFGNHFSSSLAPSAANNSTAQAASPITSSIFGSNFQVSSLNGPPAVATFGSSLFGSASAPVAAGVASSNNLFGSVTASSLAPTAFGSSTFGNNSSSMAEPKFGSTAPSSATNINQQPSFGSFGSVVAASSTSGDGASAAKKAEPAFSFGAAPGASQTTSGGFNFGGGMAKPAFNFGASTGTVANFNFTGAAAEATPNAPFQFNATATQPNPTNIFAPTPTPASTQNAQQTRRKIRAPIRRLTPR